jgi:hypothetical protein
MCRPVKFKFCIERSKSTACGMPQAVSRRIRTPVRVIGATYTQLLGHQDCRCPAMVIDNLLLCNPQL